jgi:ADP-dependent NAD(P)H-hydrate dehydratase / NAD(P)H-hydrate epimerase
MELLPVEVYSAASVRAMDRSAIDQAGIPGYTLMQRAGEAAFNVLRRHWPEARILAVLCGPGNNGGDGYVVARLARAAGLDVRVIAPAGARDLLGDAARAHADFTAAGGRTLALDADAFDGCDLAVDALLGTGIDRPLDDPYSGTIREVNRLQVPVLALDIPSGLHADTGEPQGLAVRATRTLALVALKSGYFLGHAPDHVGSLEFAGLDVPKDIRDAHNPVMRRIDAGVTARALQPRLRSAHKGDHGRVVIVGGHAMPGAARLAGEAALRTGAGLVTVATSAERAAAILAGRPELIVNTASSRPEFEELCRFSSIAIGPGLGMEYGTGSAIESALEVAAEVVLDADALNFLAGNPRKSDRWVLTPHPGEAARLLGAQPAEIQRDRLGALRGIVERYGGTCVLKGANTLVQGPTLTPWVCDRGNPGMATAGSGDVLTGVIAALLAATHDRELAATAGVFLHAEAGDRAARHGMRGMIASDIVAELRSVVNAPWT